MLTTPIDQDVKLAALMDTFPVGKPFNTFDVANLLGLKSHVADKLLREIQTALTHCPEGVQLQRGRGIETKFVEGEDE